MWPGPRHREAGGGGPLPCARYLLTPLTGNKEGSIELGLATGCVFLSVVNLQLAEKLPLFRLSHRYFAPSFNLIASESIFLAPPRNMHSYPVFIAI